LTVFLLHASYQTYYRAAYPDAYRGYVEDAAAEYHLDPALLFAMIRTESNFDPKITSPAGAKGLMQITDATFEWAQSRSPGNENLSPDALYDPKTSITYGAAVMSLLSEQFADEDTMLAAYNAGMGTVQGWLRDPAFSDDGVKLKVIEYKETRQYVARVRKAQGIYKALYE